MPVAAVFAQKCGGLPELRQRTLGPGQRPVGREERPAVQGGAACGESGEFGGVCDTG